MMFESRIYGFVICLCAALVYGSNASDDISSQFNCQLSQLFQHPNASASYGVEAVEQKIDPSTGKPTNTVVNSPKNWTLTNVLGQSNDIYTAGHPPTLEQAIFLDSSNTQPNASASASLPFAGCSFIFDVPQSDIGKADNGDCTTVLDKDCIDELQILALNSAGSLDSQQSLTLDDACGQIAANVNNSGKACQKYKSNDGITIGNGYTQYSPLHFSGPDAGNCTDPPPNIPINIFARSVPYQQNNDTMYGQWTKTITPVLLVIFTNGTTVTKDSYQNSSSAEGFAGTRLVCTSPNTFVNGTYVSTSAADRMVAATFTTAIGIALAMNALIFLFL